MVFYKKNTQMLVVLHNNNIFNILSDYKTSTVLLDVGIYHLGTCCKLYEIG